MSARREQDALLEESTVRLRELVDDYGWQWCQVERHLGTGPDPLAETQAAARRVAGLSEGGDR